MTANQSANQAWRQEAACRGLDVNLFIPEARGAGGLLYVEARRVCDSCPVKTPCLEYALLHFEDIGMWGGATPEERKEMGHGPTHTACRVCGVRFPRNANSHRYCSDECRSRRRHKTA